MKLAVPINLASRPFRQDRPMLVASAATAVLMVAVLALQIYLIRLERGTGAEIVQAIAEAEARLEQLTAREAQLQAELTRPENETVLVRSVFLNSLLLRKGISWTLIFGDLERVMPHNVKLVQIRPQVTENNEIQLEMVVASQDSEPVIKMLRNMEDSEIFSSTAVTAALPPTDNEPLYRYRVNVVYGRKL